MLIDKYIKRSLVYGKYMLMITIPDVFDYLL